MADTQLQAQTAPDPSMPKAVNILGLLPEIQRAIFSYCSEDMTKLALVCKAFHALASELIYGHVHVLMDDLPLDYSPVKMKPMLPKCLNTLATSPYNHARHLKSLSLVAPWAIQTSTQLAEYRSYVGHFVNTLLKIILPRAVRLEEIRWDIPVGIGNELLKILAAISTLAHVSIRLSSTPSTTWDSTSGLPTISTLKNLSTICILDIDGSEVISNVQACVRNSAGALKTLRVSLCSELWQASKPAAGTDTTDAVETWTPSDDEATQECSTALARMLGVDKKASSPETQDGPAKGKAKVSPGTPPGEQANTPSSLSPASSTSDAAGHFSGGPSSPSNGMPEPAKSVSKRVSDDVIDYARSTRGLALRSLGLEMIPIKASVLSQGIDLAHLQEVTLLDVGNQVPIWKLFARQNRIQPLALSSIHTDHVSKTFLRFVSQLQKLEHIHLAHTREVYPSTGPATLLLGIPECSMEEIRRFVLKKHAATLCTISIYDRRDSSWDVDEDTLMLIAERCHKLQELSASMSMRTYHCFLKQLPRFKALFAFRIITLRFGDTCNAALDDAISFLMDVLSSQPHLVLEYVCIDDKDTLRRITRLDARKERRKEIERREKKNDPAAKRKEKAQHFVTMPDDAEADIDNDYSEDYDDDDDDDDDDSISISVSSDEGRASHGDRYTGPRYILKSSAMLFSEARHDLRIFSSEIVKLTLSASNF